MIKINDDHVIIYVSKLTKEWAFDSTAAIVKASLGEAHKDKKFIVQHIERESLPPVKTDTSWHKHFG